MKKLLCVILSFLLICSFSRAVFGRAPLDFLSLLNEFSVFDFSFDSLFELVEKFKNGSFSSGFYTWNSDVNFIVNIALSISSFFSVIGDIIGSVFTTLWSLVVSVFSLFGNLLILFARLFGFIA